MFDDPPRTEVKPTEKALEYSTQILLAIEKMIRSPSPEVQEELEITRRKYDLLLIIIHEL